MNLSMTKFLQSLDELHQLYGTESILQKQS